jgi:hypothetical protein
MPCLVHGHTGNGYTRRSISVRLDVWPKLRVAPRHRPACCVVREMLPFSLISVIVALEPVIF